MKKKNIVMIVVLVTVFAVILALSYRYIFPPSPDSQVKVSIPHPVNSEFDQKQLDTLRNNVVDFSQNINPIEGRTKATTPTRQNKPQAEQRSGTPVDQIDNPSNNQDKLKER